MEIKVSAEGLGIVESLDLAFYLRGVGVLLGPFGTVLHSAAQNKHLGPPFLVTKEQLQYLYEHSYHEYNPGISASEKYRVFRDLTMRGYVLKEGFKFGCEYVAYSNEPLITHGEFLITLSPVRTHRLIELCRISHSSNKRLVVASLTNEVVSYKEISWVPGKERVKALPRK